MWLPTRAGAGDAAQASVLRCGVRVQFVLATVTRTCVSRGATGTSTCSTCTGDGESTDAVTTTRLVKSRGSTTYAPPCTRLLAFSELEGRGSVSRRQRRALCASVRLTRPILAHRRANGVVVSGLSGALFRSLRVGEPRQVNWGRTRCLDRASTHTRGYSREATCQRNRAPTPPTTTCLPRRISRWRRVPL